MYRRLPSDQKIKLIEAYLEKKETLTEICKKANISRTIFYRWLKIYRLNKVDSKARDIENINRTGERHWKSFDKRIKSKVIKIALRNPSDSIQEIANYVGISPHAAWDILKKVNLSTRDERTYASSNNQDINRVSFEKRLNIISDYESGVGAGQICDKYRISRTLLYRWIRRYRLAGQDRRALMDMRPSGKEHWRFVPGLEEEILRIIKKNPEYGLEEIEGAINAKSTIKIGKHGIYNTLKRLGLNTYEKRLNYTRNTRDEPVISKAEVEVSLPSMPKFSFPSFLSPPLAKSIFRSFNSLIVTFLTFCFGGLLVLSFILPAGSLIERVGLFIALTSLLFGVLFFIYSLKYYFSVALVLSFSRRQEENSEDKKVSSLANFLAKIFGIEANIVNKNTQVFRGLGFSKNSGGMQQDLSGIILKRNPFVSIHVSIYNEKRVIDRLLTACTSIDYPNYEVVIADDSNDETVDLIEKWRHHPRIKISHRQNRNGFKGAALAQALTITDKRAEFVMVFDADFIPYPDTVTQFLKYFQLACGTLRFKGVESDLNGSSANVAAVQGYQWHVLNKSENWITRGVRSEYSGSYVIERSGAELYKGLKQISGSVYMIRRDVLEKVGWGRSITEDFELTLRLYEKGYKVLYTPYIQTPAEAVSTIRRLIRQRMRWAEGHSYNIKRMFMPLLFGKMVDRYDNNQITDRAFVASPLSVSEKLELVYLAPYYLQAAFFIAGTLCWFFAEVVLRVRLPFWTEVWGWSLITTNMFALPLMNMIGMFMEESEEKDYLGLASFVALSYIVAPFQAYAAIKGFLEKEEGPWFRTPKTGRITDSFIPGRIAKFVRGILGRPAVLSQMSNVENQNYNLTLENNGVFGVSKEKFGLNLGLAKFFMTWHDNSVVRNADYPNHNLAVTTANNTFSSFKIKRKNVRWIGNLILLIFVITSLILTNLAPLIPESTEQALASEKRKFAQVTSNMVKRDRQVQERVEEADSDISTPKIVRYSVEKEKDLEYIFHAEPRVRTKYGQYEIDVKLTGSDGLGIVRPKHSVKRNGKYVYEEVFDGVDLQYISDRGEIREEFIMKSYKDFHSIDYHIKTIDLEVEQLNDDIAFYQKDGEKWLFKYEIPFMYEQGKAENRSYGLVYELEKDELGWKLRKVLTDEGRQWLSDPSRQFPVVIDPTQVTSVIQASITAAESDYGSPQRNIGFFPNATGGASWYAVYNDGGNIAVEKCAQSSGCDANGDWTSVTTDLDTAEADTDNEEPSIYKDGDTLYVVWFDDTNSSGDGWQYNTVDTTSDSIGTVCDGPDIGTLSDAITSIAVAADGDRYIAMSEIGGTNDAERVDRVSGTCTQTNITTSSGFDQNDRPEMLTIGNNAFLIFAADNGLRASVYVDDATPAWDTSDADVNGATADNTTTDMSAITDGTDLWIMQRNGVVGDSESFRCGSCPTTGQTWTDIAEPWGSGFLTTSFVGLSYISGSNELVAAMMEGAATTERVLTKSTDADSISWGNEVQMGFTSGASGLDNMSMTAVVASAEQVAVTVLEATNSEYEFSTLPENLWILLALLPMFPNLLKKLRMKMVKNG